MSIHTKADNAVIPAMLSMVVHFSVYILVCIVTSALGLLPEENAPVWFVVWSIALMVHITSALLIVTVAYVTAGSHRY